MKKRRLFTTLVSAASLFVLGLSACGGSGGGGGGGIAPTDIYLNKYSISMIPDETFTLEVTVDPEDAYGYKIDWSSSDTTVATVSGGTITAVGSGEATITATIRGTELSESCAVDVADPFHDYTVDGSVVLGLDYQGKNFWKDGIEKVSLLTPIDGDTAHFKTAKEGEVSGNTLKARFYGIDTPESTGKVQPWGWEASDFTKTILKKAEENGTIVVSSPSTEYAAPDPDSTGSRFVSLIWVNTEKKNAPYDELRLLNLWIVQEGLSLPKSISAFPDYEPSFQGAYNQAVVYKLNMHSGKPSEHYNYSGDYKDASLLEIRHEVELTMADPTHVNSFDNEKIRFTGVVSSYNDGTLYVQEFYPTLDPDTGEEQYDDKGNIIGEWAGINIFCGMSEIPSIYTAPNTYLQVYGLCKDSETFGFQVTDTQGHWKTAGFKEHDCRVLLTAEENIEEHALHTFEYTVYELNKVAQEKNCESLFCSVKVLGELTCTKAYVSNDGDKTLYFEGTDFNVYIPYVYYGDPSSPVQWKTEEDFKGKKFRIDGGTYAWHKTQSGNIVFQIIPVHEGKVSSFVYVAE